MEKQPETIIIELESLCGYSMVSTILNAKFSLKPIYPNKVKYRNVKRLFSEFGINADYNISDETPLYAEYYNGFRMEIDHYYDDLNDILKAFERFMNGNDITSFSIYFLKYNPDSIIPDKKAYSLNERKSILYIDEKDRLYLRSREEIKLTQMNLPEIMNVVYETVVNRKDVFKSGLVYNEIIVLNKIEYLNFDTDLYSYILKDPLLLKELELDKSVYKIKGNFYRRSRNSLMDNELR
jgi:hypothetical protein